MYFSSLEFTDFAPFAKGSRMEFAPVADKPDDLAEVHLITGENGTGKSRLLCLLAAALGDARSLQARCRKEETAEFAAGWREEEAEGNGPVMTLRLGREGLVPVGTRSDTIHKETRNTPAFARAGVSFVEDADFSKAISEHAWNEGRLNFRPGGAYTESLLKKLHKIVVAARLGENDRMLALTEKLESVLSEVMSKKFAFLPRSHPEEIMCVKLDGGPPLSLSQCPDGLRSLVGWLVDAALVMDDIANSDQSSEVGSKKVMDRAIRIAAKLDSIDEELSPLVDYSDYEKIDALITERRFLKAELYEFEIERAGAVRSHAPMNKVWDEFPCIMLLDEIETHLHPSWQWKVLPAFQKMFPKAQIFLATHSPFVIASLNKGTIHRLRRTANGVADDPRAAQEGDSYEAALEDIQDVKQRFDPESEALLEGFYKQRAAALTGDTAALEKARELVKAIARRGPELEDIIGRESRQMERQLKEKATA